MPDQIVTGRSSAYRAASEALHRDPVTERQAARFRKLWECGFADLIRADFYRLLGLPAEATCNLLDAGCGTGIEVANLLRLAPALNVHAVDVSSVMLGDAVKRSDKGDAVFYQAALERLPFAASVFDYISSHEVIEHIEDPAVVLREFARVLKPGGICAIATPNGASWWLEHLRQRLKRTLGRRGAPVGEDHTRSPSFWRREFARAGFVVERQIFDGAALEFQMLIAPPGWMPVVSRLLEPLRVVGGINLILCDRVKFRLRKPGRVGDATNAIFVACPICRTALSADDRGVSCDGGHRFVRNPAGLIDFSALAPEASAASGATTDMYTDVAPPVPRRRWRRRALLVLSTGYAGLLLPLLPLGIVLGIFHQPFSRATRGIIESY
jgi:SAM-dependent methyltransferase